MATSTSFVERAWAVWCGREPGRVVADTVADYRAAYNSFFGRFPVSDGVRISEAIVGGVPGLRLEVAGVPAVHCILYLHGGGYMSGNPEGVRDLAGRLARAAGAEAFLADYRLAPEHPHPAAVDDAVAAYLALAAEKGRALCLAGDSAGGGLVVATLLALRDGGHPMPAGAVCFSPWVDLDPEREISASLLARDTVVSLSTLRLASDAYLAGADPRTSSASPIYGDLRGVPPLLVQVGGDELLVDDAYRLAEAARSAGADATLEIVEGMPHVFQYFAAVSPEAAAALERAGRFLAERSRAGARSC